MLLKRKTLIQKLYCACSRPSSMARPARLSPAAWWPCSHLRTAQIRPLGLDSAHRAPIALGRRIESDGRPPFSRDQNGRRRPVTLALLFPSPFSELHGGGRPWRPATLAVGASEGRHRWIQSSRPRVVFSFPSLF